MAEQPQAPDPRANRWLPERWLLPPPPREPDLRARYDALPLEQRRALARTRPSDVTSLPDGDAEVAAGLARARLATSWRLLAAAPVLGWLVLMTVWGYGRASTPDPQLWLLAGGALGAAAWLGAAVVAAGRLRRARLLLAVLEADDG